MKGKNLQPRIHAKAISDLKEIMWHISKSKKFSTTNLALRRIKGSSLSKKEKTRTRSIKVIKEYNLIGKGKYTVKVVDQPLIKLVGRIKKQSSKIIYIHDRQLQDIQNKKVKNNVKSIQCGERESKNKHSHTYIGYCIQLHGNHKPKMYNRNTKKKWIQT